MRHLGCCRNVKSIQIHKNVRKSVPYSQETASYSAYELVSRDKKCIVKQLTAGFTNPCLRVKH